MAVLVSDTCVIIDLERAGLLEEMFLLPFEFVVPDLLYARELEGNLGDRLIALGLRVEELTVAELRRATSVNRQHIKLSLPDTFAFALAESRAWTLLTGDGALREVAVAEQIAMHGVLWLFDQMADGNFVAFERLHGALSQLFAHPRCRLPAKEVNHRLIRFSE